MIGRQEDDSGDMSRWADSFSTNVASVVFILKLNIRLSPPVDAQRMWPFWNFSQRRVRVTGGRWDFSLPVIFWGKASSKEKCAHNKMEGWFKIKRCEITEGKKQREQEERISGKSWWTQLTKFEARWSLKVKLLIYVDTCTIIFIYYFAIGRREFTFCLPKWWGDEVEEGIKSCL